MDIKDEYGNDVDIVNNEKYEQALAERGIDENDVVFELGARYGCPS